MAASPDLVVFVVVAGRLAGGVELDGVGWVCVSGGGGVVERKGKRSGREGGRRSRLEMHTQQTCFARVYIMVCIACEMAHTSRRSHTNDKTTKTLKKKNVEQARRICAV